MASLERYLHKKVVVLHESDLLQQAACAMRENEVGCVLVCDAHQHMVGILTDRDLGIRAWDAKLKNLKPLKLMNVMSRELISVDPQAGLDGVLSLMKKYGVRRIPVVESLQGGSQVCRGIITLDDLIAQRSVSLERASQILRSQFNSSRAHMRREDRLPGSPRAELDEFYLRLASSLGGYLDLQLPELELLTQLILQSLIQCLNRTAALHLISELPKLLEGELIPFVQAGQLPTRVEVLQAELSHLLRVDQSTARWVLNRFGHLLEEWFDSRTFQQIKAQLPGPYLLLFSENQVQGRAG